MEVYARIPRLALLLPAVDLKEPICISMGCLPDRAALSVTGVLAQGRGGKETPILSSQFLACNWLGVHQSPQRPACRVPPWARGGEAGRTGENREGKTRGRARGEWRLAHKSLEPWCPSRITPVLGRRRERCWGRRDWAVFATCTQLGDCPENKHGLNPFYHPRLALVFIWSHQIVNLPRAGNPLLLGQQEHQYLRGNGKRWRSRQEPRKGKVREVWSKGIESFKKEWMAKSDKSRKSAHRIRHRTSSREGRRQEPDSICI